jgi:hypothetical protein
MIRELLGFTTTEVAVIRKPAGPETTISRGLRSRIRHRATGKGVPITVGRAPG